MKRFALTLLLALVSLPAIAGDAVEIMQGSTIYTFEGTLIDRLEDGNSGSIEFGAMSRATHPRRPTSRVEAYVGDYDVTIIPSNGVQGFEAEHCRRGFARYNSVSGTTYIRFVCP